MCVCVCVWSGHDLGEIGVVVGQVEEAISTSTTIPRPLVRSLERAHEKILTARDHDDLQVSLCEPLIRV